MPYVNCQICQKAFYAKPRHLKIGWGRFCSRECQSRGRMNGFFVQCTNCKKRIYRTPKHLKHSKGNNFFCDRSCLAIWKNERVLIGEKHPNWKHGENAYRNIMKRSDVTPLCKSCNTKDTRVLLVHHIDKNRKNNNLENLMWLCHNCHFLVHHYNEEREKLMVPVA